MNQNPHTPNRAKPRPPNPAPGRRRGALLALAAGFALLAAGCVAPGETPNAAGEGHVTHDTHIIAHPDDIEWQDGPASLPPGARFALLQGNPAERNFIALRLSFPPEYEIPPHWHEAVEHVTVLEGTFYVGMGSTFDRDAADALSAGSFSVVPNTEPHYAFTRDEPVVFQLHSMGPWGITYVDPADDPRQG